MCVINGMEGRSCLPPDDILSVCSMCVCVSVLSDALGRRWSGDDKSIRVSRRIRLMKVTAGPPSHSAMTQSCWWAGTSAHTCSYWIPLTSAGASSPDKYKKHLTEHHRNGFKVL